MDLMKRQATDLWQVVDESPQQTLPTVQPVTNITYNVHIDGAAGWLAVLAHMPTMHVLSGAVVVGVLGAAVLGALMVIATTIMGLGFYLLVAVALFLIAAVAMTAIGR